MRFSGRLGDAAGYLIAFEKLYSGEVEVTVELYAFTCGHLTIPTSFMVADRGGSTRVPVTSYLVVHPQGAVLFDSGLHLTTQHDARSHLGDLLVEFIDVDHRPGEEIAAQLPVLEFDPAAVTHVVNSHLHYDHCGGNATLPNATIVTQREEWEAAHELGPPDGYIAADFDTGQPVQLIDGEHEVFGDGSVVCFPTVGHTRGHQSMRVRTTAGGDFVLCGDACYLRESLETGALPGLTFDADATRQSLQRLRELQLAGARIMYGHDPEFWSTVTMAPCPLG